MGVSIHMNRLHPHLPPGTTATVMQATHRVIISTLHYRGYIQPPSYLDDGKSPSQPYEAHLSPPDTSNPWICGTLMMSTTINFNYLSS
jgi:hypothetical protein